MKHGKITSTMSRELHNRTLKQMQSHSLKCFPFGYNIMQGKKLMVAPLSSAPSLHAQRSACIILVSLFVCMMLSPYKYYFLRNLLVIKFQFGSKVSSKFKAMPIKVVEKLDDRRVITKDNCKAMTWRQSNTKSSMSKSLLEVIDDEQKFLICPYTQVPFLQHYRFYEVELFIRIYGSGSSGAEARELRNLSES